MKHFSFSIAVAVFFACGASAAPVDTATYVTTPHQRSLIKNSFVHEGSCQYLQFEKCSLPEGETIDQYGTFDASKLSCTQLFPHTKAIAVNYLSGLVFMEKMKVEAKGMGIPLAFLAGATAVGVACIYTVGGCVVPLGAIGFGLAGGATVGVATSGVTAKYISAMRYVNPYFNGAVAKLLTADRGQEVRFFDTEDLIRQSDAVEKSFGFIDGKFMSGNQVCAESLRD